MFGVEYDLCNLTPKVTVKGEIANYVNANCGELFGHKWTLDVARIGLTH